jgi:hypothetical protein
MIRTTRLAFALGLAVALAACQQASPPASTAAPAAPAAAPTTPAATPAPAAPAATASSIGVADCDEYLNKYQACVESKVPESARATLITSLDQTRAAWRAAAATPAGKDGLTAACKQMRDSARASMSAYGCTDF